MKIRDIINHNWTITIVGGIVVGIIISHFSSSPSSETNNKPDTIIIPNPVKQEVNVILSTPVLSDSLKEIKKINESDSFLPETGKDLVIYGEGYSDEFTENEARTTARKNALNDLLNNYDEDSQKAIVKRYKVTETDTMYKTVRGTWEGKCQYSFDEKYLKSHEAL